MNALYQVRNWNERYENNRSRKVMNCTALYTPNDEGPASNTIHSQENGLAIMGVWFNLLKLCSRQRAPRYGYITLDGQRDSWRLGPDELATIWKSPAATVRRALRVLSSSQVGLVKIVDGGSDVSSDTNAVTSSDVSSDTSPVTSSDVSSDTSPVTSSDVSSDTSPVTSSDTNDVNEGRNEGKKEVLSLKGEKADLILHHEAKILFGKLCQEVFGEPRRETQWPNDEEHFLNAILPLQDAEFELVDWFYRLPADHEIFKVTRRRQSLRSLLENWKSEVQKIRMARSAAGLNGLHEAEFSDGWTPERIAIRSEILPNEGEWPARFDELPVFVRRRFNEVVKLRREKNA